MLQGHKTWRQGDIWYCRDTGHGGRETPGAAGRGCPQIFLVLREHMAWRQGDIWYCKERASTEIPGASGTHDMEAGRHLVVKRQSKSQLFREGH